MLGLELIFGFGRTHGYRTYLGLNQQWNFDRRTPTVVKAITKIQIPQIKEHDRLIWTPYSLGVSLLNWRMI